MITFSVILVTLWALSIRSRIIRNRKFILSIQQGWIEADRALNIMDPLITPKSKRPYYGVKGQA